MYVLVVYICISYSLNYNLMRQLHCVQTEVKLQQSSVSVWVKTQVTRNISEGKLERKHIPNLPRVLYGVRCIRYQGCTHAQVWQSPRQVWFGSKDRWFFPICNHPYLDDFSMISNNRPILDDFALLSLYLAWCCVWYMLQPVKMLKMVSSSLAGFVQLG